MTESKTMPSRLYIARAVPCNGGFRARYAFPGVTPRLFQEGGSPKLFRSEEAATVAAATELIRELNNRPGMPGATRPKSMDDGTVIDRPIPPRRKTERYERLSGSELSVLLAETGITLSFFQYLYNTNAERLLTWMGASADDDRAPHPVRVLLEIFKAYPDTINVAETITDSVTSPRKPREK